MLSIIFGKIFTYINIVPTESFENVFRKKKLKTSSIIAIHSNMAVILEEIWL